jgi:hypothetical protein
VRFAVRFLGLELLTIEASTDEAAEGEELAGGTLGTERIEVGQVDRFMGFTNGRECDE